MKTTLTLLIICSVFLLAAGRNLVAEDTPATRTQTSPQHHDGKSFLNPFADKPQGGFFGIVRARLSKEWMAYDADRDLVPTTTPGILPAGGASNNVTVTWIGHASVLIQHRGINVLTDPMFSNYASPVSFAGPRRITQPAADIEALPPIHAVIISHDHYDHLDTASIKRLGDRPMYFVPLGIKRWLIKKGITAERIVEMDWWDESTLPVGE